MVVVHHKFKTVLLTANRKQIFNINISFSVLVNDGYISPTVGVPFIFL